MHRRFLRYLRVPDGGRTAQEVQALWEEGQALMQAATWQRCLGAAEFFALFHPHAAASQALGRLLAGCTQVVLMIATLGDQLERRAKSCLERREVFRGYVLDRLGSYLVEHQMRLLDRRVARQAATHRLVTTKRYSPGYQDFSLESQQIFLDLAAGDLPGLRLSSAGMLLPEKTITALKGLTAFIQ